MKVEALTRWMQPQYTEGSVSSRVSRLRRIEADYGDLDALYEKDGLTSVLAELSYSKTDERAGKPNPTKLAIGGDLYRQLASLKNAVAIYRQFRADEKSDPTTERAIEIAGEVLRERREGRSFELERHLQASLRLEIDQLEPGLRIIDGGDERAVSSGFIDILAEDADGLLTVIELKAGQARREAVGQILGYMGDLQIEEPGSKIRGILVASAFDKSCIAATAVVRELQLREYRFDFSFLNPLKPE